MMDGEALSDENRDTLERIAHRIDPEQFADDPQAATEEAFHRDQEAILELAGDGEVQDELADALYDGIDTGA